MKTIQVKFDNKSVEFTNWDDVTLFSAKQQANTLSEEEYSELVNRAKTLKNGKLFTPIQLKKLLKTK